MVGTSLKLELEDTRVANRQPHAEELFFKAKTQTFKQIGESLMNHHRYTLAILIVILPLIAPVVVHATTSLQATAIGVAKVEPDLVAFKATASEVKQDAVEAQRASKLIVLNMKRSVQRFALVPDSLDSSEISLNPEYRWDRSLNQQVFTGYRASQIVRFKTTGTRDIGAVMNALTSAGATSIDPPRLESTQSTTAKHEALTQAVKNVRLKLEIMAESLGKRLVSLDTISESTLPRPSPVNGFMRAESTDSSNGSPVINVGNLSYTVEVVAQGTAQ